MSGIAEGLFAEQDDPRSYKKLVTVEDLIKFEDALPALSSGGGIDANHGNTAYVSVYGDDRTGVVGNISKPFETANAAIAALDNAVDGAIVILSSSGPQFVTDYDYSTMPYIFTINDICSCGITFNNSCSFGDLRVNTGGDVLIDTNFLFSIDNSSIVNCDDFIVLQTAQGDINFYGNINCNAFTVNLNTNNPSLTFDVINWKNSLAVNEPITYNRCNPMVYKAILSQSGTSAPTATVLENTTGETPTYSRSSGGVYFIDSPGSKFTTSTVMNMTASANAGGSYFPVFSFQRTSSSRLIVECYEVSAFALGDYIGPSGLAIEIEIYP